MSSNKDNSNNNKATAVSDDARRKANLRVLQRTDACIHDIVESANFVGLYEFQQHEQQWEKKSTEGSLFLVQRNHHINNNNNGTQIQQSSPTTTQYQLIILNRTSPENWILPVTPKLQLQNQEPYLILRYKKEDDATTTTSTNNKTNPDITISGIWFHNNSERDAIATSLKYAVDELNKHQADLAAVATTAITLDPTVAATALLSPLTLGGVVIPVSHVPATTQTNSSTARPGTTMYTNDTSTPPRSSASTSSSQQSSSNTHQQQHIVLDKKSLQLSLLSLIQDDRFLDLIHAQYLKVAHARANRTPTTSTTTTNNNYTKGGGGGGSY